MNLTARIALLALFAALPAQAQDTAAGGPESAGDDRPGIVIDTNLFCDSQAEVERFVTLFDGNHGNAEAAIDAVNTEHNTVDACVIATAAYRRGEAVAAVRHDDIPMHVVRIEVVGVYTINGFEPALPAPFFTLVPEDATPGTVGQR